MSVKRPAILFLSSFILGIIIAYSSIPVYFKLLLVIIAIFLYLKLYYDGKINKKILVIIFLFAVFGFFRFKACEYSFDKNVINVESLGKGNKVLSGKIDRIGKSTNSNYYILSNCVSGGVKLGTCRVYFDDEINPELKIGNLVKVNAGTSIIEGPLNEGEFNQKNYYRSNGISFIAFAKDFEVANYKYSFLKQSIYEIKLNIKSQIAKIFNEKDAGLFSAMVTGDKSEIDLRQKKLFSDNGIAHILAISGLHLSILGIAIFELLRKKFTVNFSAGIVSVFILLYGIFIDAGPSSLRAITMLYVRFLSLAVGRAYDSKNTLYIVCFAFLIINPYLLFNAGFQFSYLAIFALNSKIRIPRKKLLESKPTTLKKFNSRYIRIPEVITLNFFLFPVTVYHYFTYPLYGIVLNLIVIPLMSFVLGFGLIGLLVSFFNLSLGKMLVYVVHLIFIVYDKLCEFASILPKNLLWVGQPNLYQILYYYVALFLIIYVLKNLYEGLNQKNNLILEKVKFINYRILVSCKVIICYILLIISILIIGNRERNDLRMTFLAIGQGDSVIIESKEVVMSVDGGSSSNKSNGQYILNPHIKSRAHKNIDYAFITHADSDHTNGIIYLLENEEELNIENLILPINAKTDDKFSGIKDAAIVRNVNISYLKQGDILKPSEDIVITMLSPDEDSLRDTKMDQNELSLTFRFDYKNHSALFTGDIGKRTINRMIRDEYANKYFDVEVLKAPHHGSKNSNVSEFFKMVSPDYTVISYGRNNSYGHPHQATIDSLNEVKSKILKTAELGQIDLYFDQSEIYYKTFKNDK